MNLVMCVCVGGRRLDCGSGLEEVRVAPLRRSPYLQSLLAFISLMESASVCPWSSTHSLPSIHRSPWKCNALWNTYPFPSLWPGCFYYESSKSNGRLSNSFRTGTMNDDRLPLDVVSDFSGFCIVTFDTKITFSAKPPPRRRSKFRLGHLYIWFVNLGLPPHTNLISDLGCLPARCSTH